MTSGASATTNTGSVIQCSKHSPSLLTSLCPRRQISTIDNCRTSPYLLRIFFGLVSDILPLRWQHRKPYLMLGIGKDNKRQH